jgi:hypothetical protein
MALSDVAGAVFCHAELRVCSTDVRKRFSPTVLPVNGSG